MDYKYIEQLIERYWAAETSVEEERILRDFFSQSDIPSHLRAEAEFFRAMDEESRMKLDDAFDERILSRVESADNQIVVPIRTLGFTARFRPFFRAAAAVAIVFTLSYSIVHSVEDKSPQSHFAVANDTTIVTDYETVQPVQVGVKTAAADSSVVNWNKN